MISTVSTVMSQGQLAKEHVLRGTTLPCYPAAPECRILVQGRMMARRRYARAVALPGLKAQRRRPLQELRAQGGRTPPRGHPRGGQEISRISCPPLLLSVRPLARPASARVPRGRGALAPCLGGRPSSPGWPGGPTGVCLSASPGPGRCPAPEGAREGAE
ncbi:unnamed protein product [Prorocentrum cordatum]|uniref:Uncharacterized protein n=1 Tax=Prorocentrum cordatum TaxID=2364126 RepID=A0ABN9PKP9_9DINO|nr:unnamed protein product [Polarella glacialis]